MVMSQRVVAQQGIKTEERQMRKFLTTAAAALAMIAGAAFADIVKPATLTEEQQPPWFATIAGKTLRCEGKRDLDVKFGLDGEYHVTDRDTFRTSDGVWGNITPAGYTRDFPQWPQFGATDVEVVIRDDGTVELNSGEAGDYVCTVKK